MPQLKDGYDLKHFIFILTRSCKTDCTFDFCGLHSANFQLVDQGKRSSSLDWPWIGEDIQWISNGRSKVVTSQGSVSQILFCTTFYRNAKKHVVFTLRNCLEQKVDFPTESLRCLAKQLLEGLYFCHWHKILHRDLRLGENGKNF